MRKLFMNMGCLRCPEAINAVNVFNSKRTPDKWIEKVILQGEALFENWAVDYRWKNLVNDCFKDKEHIKVPFLIFDGILIRDVDDFVQYLGLLEELDKGE